MNKPHPDPPNPHATHYLVWTTDSDDSVVGRSLEPVWHWSVSGPRGFQSGCEVNPFEATERAQYAYGVVRGDHERRDSASST